MQTDLQTFETDASDDVHALKREIDSLRRQLNERSRNTRPLSWDTDLLVRKSENLTGANVVSCSNPNWRDLIEHIEIGSDGIRVNDIHTVEHIEFVAAFAARRQLAMTYGSRSFFLEPRPSIN